MLMWKFMLSCYSHPHNTHSLHEQPLITFFAQPVRRRISLTEGSTNWSTTICVSVVVEMNAHSSTMNSTSITHLRSTHNSPRTHVSRTQSLNNHTSTRKSTHKQAAAHPLQLHNPSNRSEEHTSELQSLMRISYAVFCLKKKKHKNNTKNTKTKQNNNITIQQ